MTHNNYGQEMLNLDTSTEDKDLQKELQRHRVEEGRLKKVQSELDAERARREELEARIAELEQRKEDEAYRSYIPEDSYTDPDTLDASAKIAHKAVSSMEQRLQSQLNQLQNQIQRGAMSNNAGMINDVLNRRYPGIVARLNGPDNAAWRVFLQSSDPVSGDQYSNIAQKAMANGNIEAMLYVVDKYVEDSRSSAQFNVSGAVAPASSASSMPTPMGQKPIYRSIADLESMMNRAVKDFERGKITRAQKNEVLAEYNSAFAEGRVGMR